MTVRIAGREVGPGVPVYIVAELSGNHNGDVERAVALIHAAADAGADAVKLQTYTADTLTLRSDRPEFLIPGTGPWSGRTLYDLYQEAHTPWDWHARLYAEARARGLAIFSTPFDETAVDLLESLDSPAYKVASFELVDDQLLRLVAARGKPVILSTGMATLEEIEHAVSVLREGGATEVVLLRCTSSYPAPDAQMHLATIPELSRRMQCPVGLSDHSLGTTAPVVAVALGACFVEKHLTLRRADGGVDSHFSLEPAEFADLVRDVRRAEAMLGRPTFGAGAAEEGNIAFRRSLYVVRDVAAGESLTPDNVRSIRPGFGLAPRHRNAVLGSRAVRAAQAGTPVSWDLLHTNGHADRRND
jgi:N-acetylneuraminate synthase